MMDRILLKIILASLIHDIGKIYERSKKPLSKEFIKNNQDLYQPFYQGRYTHFHSLYTANFIENFRDYIPEIFFEEESSEDSLINLAAKHHKPESLWQLIIHEADCLSSGYERRSFEEEVYPEKHETSADFPLLCLFEDINLEEKWKENRIKEFKYAYEISQLHPEKLFPQNINSKLSSKELYANLIEDFEKFFKNLPFKNDRPDLWLESLNTLLMKYLLFIPSATVGISYSGKLEKIHSDISLYDHLYFTASLASALYIYHKNTDTFTESSIKNRDLLKFLFIEGNFYGIQKFIFSSGGETRKWAAKILRARSFLVSLISELVAYFILQKLSQPFVSLIFSAAGKFLLLVPNTDKISEFLPSLEEEINDWFYENFYGETSLGLVSISAKPSDFLYPEGYTSLMKNLSKKSEEKKYKKFDLLKYGGVYKDYFLKFSGLGTCQLCGKRPAEGEKILIRKELEEKVRICNFCLDQVKLGENLVKKEFLAIFSINKPKGTFSTPILNFYRIEFLSEKDINQLDPKHLYHIWDLSLYDDEDKSRTLIFSKKFINAYVPKEESSNSFNLLTLEDLAEKSLTQKNGEYFGIRALGVLKADVDNLGDIFNRGFRESKRTFSRFLALSRMLNLFFAYYLPYLCKKSFKNIYNVFCGGDDLFVIGPWKDCYEFAKVVNEKFKTYVCYNPYFSISAGYLLTKPNLPITDLAEKTENALHHSKNEGKNRLTIFRESILWSDIPKLEEIKEYLYQLLANEIISRAFLYKLNEIIYMAKEAQKIIKYAEEKSLAGVPFNQLVNLLWPSKFYYFTVRNFDKTKLLNKEERQKEQEKFLLTFKDALETYGGALKLPLWKTIYSIRRAGHDGD